MAHAIKTSSWLIGLVALSVGCGTMAVQPAHHKQAAKMVTVNNTKNQALSKQANRAKSKKVTSASQIVPSSATIRRGSMLFSQKCAVCHGPDGVGTQNAPRLAAPTGVVSGFQTEASLKTFISEQMPANAPGSLTHQQARDVTAYVWHIAEAK